LVSSSEVGGRLMKALLYDYNDAICVTHVRFIMHWASIGSVDFSWPMVLMKAKAGSCWCGLHHALSCDDE
jgi:hypothetical protein